MNIPTPILAAIETAMNAWFRLDGETLNKFSSLENKIIRLHITNLDVDLYFLPSTTSVAVLGQYPQDANVDATISGSIAALVSLSNSKNVGKTLLESDVEIDGEMRVAEKFSAILAEVDIDWEELLSRIVGDMAAHSIGNTAGSIADWLKESADAMRLNTSEYLTEEAKVSPTESELNYFMEQVDEIAIDVDRLEARIKLLLDTTEESADLHDTPENGTTSRQDNKE